MRVGAKHCELWRAFLGFFILCILVVAVVSQTPVNLVRPVHASIIDPPTTIAPSQVWGTFFGTSGDVEIDLNRAGIAVRVEIPREFLQGVVSGENDTHFIQTNIRNDFYYYSVIDESAHWDYGGSPYNRDYGRAGFNVTASDGPCFKPRFALRDPNAPWCAEIWNYFNGTFLTFTPPKFIRFHNLNSPSIAGTYNFTLFIADHRNGDSEGYPSLCQNPTILPPNFCSLPDFVHAWNTTLLVPVSMRDDPASISGSICDVGFSPSCPAIKGTKGVAFAQNSNGQIVARAFVNNSNGVHGGEFNITGLAPGDYQVLASAGFNPNSDVAYALSPLCPQGSPYCVHVGAGDSSPGHVVQVNRAPEVCGRIDYHGPSDAPIQALSQHPYLPGIGLKVLNITIEAVDSQQHTYRNLTLFHTLGTDPIKDPSTDTFRLMTGSNWTYVGTDPYGTEFAGLQPLSTLTINVFVSGYLQVNLDGSPQTVTATVNQLSPGFTGDPCLANPTPPTIVLRAGGAISGTIQFRNFAGLETPHQAEASLPLGGVTDALFGGNVLIQAYDHLGVLRGVSVLNGTLPDGRVCYASLALSPFCSIKLIQVGTGTGTQFELAFTIIGFNEYLNNTWSGVWDERDYGLPPDSGYSIQVYINGYSLNTTTSIPLTLGSTASNVQIHMLRGGAFKVGVFSFDNRLGTRATQSQIAFRSLNLTIPFRARVYFYDSSGIAVGYVECTLRLVVTQPDKRCHLGTTTATSAKTSFTVIFAGQNWSMREIWFYGDTPSHVRTDTYSIKTYTLGYVWQNGPIQAQNSLVGFSQASVTLLLGDEIDITGPIFVAQSILGTLPENDHVIGQATGSSGLSGATTLNATAGTATLQFKILGFGGIVFGNGTLEGQGHFFYVSPSGALYFDFGLENTTAYSAEVPEFGFNRHFMEPFGPEIITFSDLFLEAGVVMSDMAMAKVESGAFVTGWVSVPVNFDVTILSWVQVTASNGTFTRTVPTLDGVYGGVGALHLPQGTYNITFSVLFYKSQTKLNLQVQWGGTYVSIPPDGPLCPTGGISGTCDPPATLSISLPLNAASSQTRASMADSRAVTALRRIGFDS